MSNQSNSNPNWSGVLTIENLRSVAERLTNFLKGKKFCFVAVNGLRGFVPEVKTSMSLLSEPHIGNGHNGEPPSGFHFKIGTPNSGFVFSCFTGRKDEEEKRDAGRETFFTFSENQVEVNVKDSMGSLTWIFAL
jgi:hypothetical protein